MGRIYDDLRATRATAQGAGRRNAQHLDPRLPRYVAACACGWTGGEHPPTEHGYDAAVDEWDEHHARPLLAEAVPPAVREAIHEARAVERGVIALAPLMRAVRGTLFTAARQAGFERLRVTATRLSGSRPGRIVDVTIDLEREAT